MASEIDTCRRCARKLSKTALLGEICEQILSEIKHFSQWRKRLTQKLQNSCDICVDKTRWMQTSVSRPQIDGNDFILMDIDGIVEMWKRKTSF